MNAEKIIQFVKVNGGATVALFLSLIYINKLETRLEKVEQQLHDCYTRSTAINLLDYSGTHPNPLVCVLPKETKIETNGKRKNQKIA
jgi:hypothetical protein